MKQLTILMTGFKRIERIVMNKDNLEKIFNDDLGSSYFPELAEVYIKDGDYARAKKVCNIGLLLNPSNNDGKFILAKIEMIKGNGKVAETLLKEVLSDDSLYINAMRLLVMHYNSKSIKKNSAILISCVSIIISTYLFFGGSGLIEKLQTLGQGSVWTTPLREAQKSMAEWDLLQRGHTIAEDDLWGALKKRIFGEQMGK